MYDHHRSPVQIRGVAWHSTITWFSLQVGEQVGKQQWSTAISRICPDLSKETAPYLLLWLQHVETEADDVFKCIFLNENIKISIKISLNFVSKGLINNISTTSRYLEQWWLVHLCIYASLSLNELRCDVVVHCGWLIVFKSPARKAFWIV